MDTSKLKSFAPACRRQLIAQIETKLEYVLTTRTPDLIAQEQLVESLRRDVARRGREVIVEETAYTWFNRLAALRYLDAREWHPFRIRVITSAAKDAVQPDLLQTIRQGEVPEELHDYISRKRTADLLSGALPSQNPQAEVQRLIVIGVCQYYAFLLPHLFARLDDVSQLLLPDDLLTDLSVANGFRTEISDDDCAEVEVLGWLYQFYISEKKDAVMARKKAVPSEDIPAVTQLFTPHWIVRYLVENSLGRLWLRSRPNSRLKEHMPYYVEDPEGQAPTDSLTVATPEEIKLLDPASGSGHMLTYAFDLLVKIYEEEGHAPSEIPEKILTHNLFGLEICPRAAQLAQFALVCKAREHSRAAFRRPVQPQVMCLQNIVITPEEVQGWCDATGVEFTQDELSQIHQFRENTETFGALIQPVLDGEEMAVLREKLSTSLSSLTTGDLLTASTHRKLRLVLDQAEMLSQRYQAAISNPPYMGRGAMNGTLKSFVEEYYPNSKADLFSVFIERNNSSLVYGGTNAMITMQSWMFLSSFEELREELLAERYISSMAHLGSRAFDTIGGDVVQSTAFTIQNQTPTGQTEGVFIRLVDGRSEAEKAKDFRIALRDPDCTWRFRSPASDFKKIPGSPIAYFATPKVLDAFTENESLEKYGLVRQGASTSDNDRFLRLWHEVENEIIGKGLNNLDEASTSELKWFPYNKGGPNKKWYGNHDFLINYQSDGKELKEFQSTLNQGWTVRLKSREYYFRESVSWPKISSGNFSARYYPKGFIFDVAGCCYFPKQLGSEKVIVAFLNSRVVKACLKILSPTLNYEIEQIKKVPFIELPEEDFSFLEDVYSLARADWDNFETSWDFRDLPLLRSGDWEVVPGQSGGPWKGRTLAESWDHYATYCTAAIRRMQELETENNRLWIDAYGLQDELDPAVPEDEITLARANKRKDMAAFLSYAIGCMMGRYSLDQPGLILADAGDTLEQYFEKLGKTEEEVSFLPDDDAIIPITEDDWFEDDAAARVREFLKVTFGPETLEENVTFIEEALGKSLRKYFTANTGGFYADHVQTYKKRPIYWMFQSPKKHFRALVYLHRYTRDTVNTLLNGYLREFRHKLTAKIGDLEALTTPNATERKALKKAQEALLDIENYERDLLLPLAQERIHLDLDDGVKANYPKFGKALAKVAGLS